MVSPWGFLGAVIAYTVAAVPYWCALPGIADDDEPGSLNLFVGLVARSGGSKGRIVKAARRYVGRADLDLPPGSGEGLVKLFVRRDASKPSDDHRPSDVFTVGGDRYAWTRRAVLLNVPEIDTLDALMRRSSSTLPSLLRQGFSGETLGFGYADDTKRAFVPGGEYRLTMLVGVQPTRSGALFDDADGGTPQRFLFLPTEDSQVSRHNRPAKPAPIDPNVFAGEWPHEFTIPACATEEIEIAAEARARGEGDALDGHRLFVRAKVAAALAVLDGRRWMTEDDWRLSAVVMAVGDRTRAVCVAALGEAAQAANVARGRSDGMRSVIADETAHTERMRRVAATLTRAVAKHGPTPRGKVQSLVSSRYRDVWADALDLAIERGDLVESDGVVSVSSP